MMLDPRQRAMLAEMGVRVWQPGAEAPEPATLASAPPRATPVAAQQDTPVAAVTAPAGGWALDPPRLLYPDAASGGTPAWLIALDSPTPDEPGAGEAGELLHKMLRAMRLHGRSGVFVSTVRRSDAGGAANAQRFADALAQSQPALVLALGLGAARAVLGGSEPLASLRTAEHRLADGMPVVVSYAPAYLVRAPQAKGAAWADLQRAMALAEGAMP